MYHILIVEDDLENCTIMALNFQKTGEYKCVFAHNAEEALSAVQHTQFDIILLDIMLPGIDGIELCTKFRSILYCPILFISCLDDEETIVHALRMGGDDYITKPFRFPVLLAHIEATLRRMQPHQAEEDYWIGDKVLSIRSHALKKGEEHIPLSPTEFELLLYFIHHANTVIRFEEIYQYIWKQPSVGDLRTLFSHIRNLRKKLEKDPSQPAHIITIPRVGYQFVP